MKKQNIEILEREMQAKYRKREKKKSVKMKIDGANVRKLAKIIGKK